MSTPDYGTFAVAYRQDGSQPWIGLPGVSTEGTAREMFDAANLGGWNVRTREVKTDARTDKPDFEILRDNPIDGGLDRLGMLKSRYTPVQCEDYLTLAENVSDGDLTPVAMGHFNGGRKFFLAFEFGENIVVDPNGSADEIGLFFTLLGSHDGSLSVWGLTGNMRFRCQNMINGIKSTALTSFKFRHTATVEGRMLDARTALSIGFKSDKVLMEEMNALLAQKCDDQRFWEIVSTFDPKPEKDVKGSLKKWETRTDRLMDLWYGRAVGGATVDNLEDTLYKAYNVFNEDEFWYRQMRKGNPESSLVSAAGFDEQGRKRNAEIYKNLMALAA